MYLVHTPWWLKSLYPSLMWQVETNKKEIYITFDDGPHKTITPFVIDTLKAFNAKATFFCIGKNVIENIEIFERIISEGHSIGNHTHNHLNGFKTPTDAYIENIKEAEKYINSNLFRPPYGRIKRAQINKLQAINPAIKIVMWSVLSGDFDTNITDEQCLQNITRSYKNGSIIVFHDSEKAWQRLQYALPETLEHFSKEGYQFKALSKK